MENVFSLRRLIYMIRKDLSDNIKFVLISYIAFIGFFSGIFLIGLYIGFPLIKLDNFFISGLFIVGYFISGIAFIDLRNKEKTIFYLCLPASVQEKFFSTLLLTTVIFVISFIPVFYIFNSFAYFMGNSFFSTRVAFVNIADANILKFILIYILTQPVFLIGSATFKKVPGLIIGAIIFVLIIVLFIYSNVIGSYIFSDLSSNAKAANFSPAYSVQFLPMYFEGNLFFLISGYVAKFVVPLLLWYVVYLKLKNKTV